MMPRIYIRDQNDEVLDTLDEGQYFDDNMQRFLKGKATVLSFTIVKDEASYALMTAGRNLSFRFDEEDFWLSCVIVEQDETYLTVTAWSLGLELNNETHGPYKAPKAMTFAEYLAVIDIERILTIGINEVADKKISHEWEGTESKLARLYSLATVFGTELAFDTELNEDGSLKQISLNVYREHSDTDQGLGQDRRNETFYFGEDIKTIRKTEDTSDLYTAIFATGKDGLTIAGIEKEVFDEDGNLLFATYKTQKPGFGDPRKLYAPQARDQFPSNTTGGDRWTLNTAGEFEYESAEALLGYMMSELKKNCQPATTWEIEGYIKAKIGDTVRIADEGYKPTLYLEARVIEQEISFSDKTKNKSTFSNVVELESQVDSSLLDRVQKLIEANKTYQYSISTDNGIVFKNNAGTTTLTATVRDGVADVTTNFAIAWFKDGVAVGSGISITVQATEVVEKAVYRFEASRDGNVVGGYEVTVSDVSDGEAGQTPVVHPAWAWSADGTDRFCTEYPGSNLYNGTDSFRLNYYKPYSENTNTIYSELIDDNWRHLDLTAIKPTTHSEILANPALYLDIESGKTYTQSFLVRTDCNVMASEDSLNWFSTNSGHNYKTLYSKKISDNTYLMYGSYTATANLKLRLFDFSSRIFNVLDSGTYLDFKGFKIEKGENLDPIYTPAPSEDYANAYPLYEGTYTDYSETASQNPADYTWRRIIGESGQDGNNGADGVGIANTKIDYQLHTSATTPPTGTWVTSPPAVTVGKYLWTRTILEYTDGTKSTPAYSVSGGPGANGSDGKDGQDGAPGVDALPIFSGYVTNEAIVLMATNSGAVSDFSKATGTFVTYLGQDQLTSGVTYSRVSQSGVTATINTTTGAYSVTAASADSGMVVFKAVYQGIELQKIVSVTKAKQGAVGATGAPGADGATGDTGPQGPPTGVVAQDTVPDTPYIGMLWQCTGNIDGYINPATYRWNGSAWTIYQFTAQNILAETFTGFVFRGVEFIGSRFVNEWTDSQAGNTGRMQIADGELTSDYWLTGSSDENNTAGGHFSISRDGILTSTWKNETVNQSRGYVLTDQFLEFFYNGRSDLNGSGRLTALQLTKVPWTNLPYESGFTTAENNPCQYRVVHLLDGSRELQMRGQVQNTAGTALPTATSPYIGLLPATARPIRNELVAAADSSRKGARVAVLKNGYIQIDTPNANTTYVSLGGIRILLE